MAMAGLGKALEAAATGATSYQKTKEDRRAVQRQAAEDVLATKRATAAAQPENIDAEFEAMRTQNKALSAKIARSESYNAFKAYNADSDTRHVNKLLKDNPELRELYGNVVSVDKVDLTNDTNLLQREGMDLSLFQDPEFNKEAFQHRFLKVTLPDGNKRVVDMQQAMIGTGYANHAAHEDIDLMLKRSKLFGKSDGGQPSALEKKAQYMAGFGEMTEAQAARRLFDNEVAGVTPGKLAIANSAENALEETFNKKFFSTDFSDRKNRVQASSHIRAIEQAGGESLSAADKADLKDISMLLASGTTVAEELSPEATGIFDNFTSNVRKYLDDEQVEQTTGRAAYSAYRNALLRSFGGTAMSDSEVQNFNTAFGTLAQKYPAVLSQFKQAIEQTKAKLETISRLNNPYLAHYYLGAPIDDVEIIVAKLDENLERIRSHQKRAEPPEPTTPGKSEDWRGLWREQQ